MLKVKICHDLPFCPTFPLGEEHRRGVFENRVLRKIFGPKREEDIVDKIA
jgi:hypothetical protein